jgi:hypothetical protein
MEFFSTSLGTYYLGDARGIIMKKPKQDLSKYIKG